MKSQKVVYPGSFDPITLGHVDIIQRLCASFGEVVVLVAQSAQKNSLFTGPERKSLIEKTLPHLKNMRVDLFEGLTTEYMKKHDIKLIVRGLRAVVDYEYELTMANMNKKLSPEVETLLVFASPEYYFISSRGVKEVAQNGGSLEGLVPEPVISDLLAKLGRSKN
jgi:pantetheine-phosphate adenylyltransferase